MTQLLDSKRQAVVDRSRDDLFQQMACMERKIQRLIRERNRLKEEVQNLRELRARDRIAKSGAGRALIQAGEMPNEDQDWHWQPVAAILRAYKRPMTKRLIVTIHGKARFPTRKRTSRASTVLNALTHLRRHNKAIYSQENKTWSLTPLGEALIILTAPPKLDRFYVSPRA